MIFKSIKFLIIIKIICISLIITAAENNSDYQNAQYYYEMGRYDFAISNIDSAIRRDKNNPVYYRFKGDILYKQNKQIAALEFYKEALTLNRNQPDLLMQVGIMEENFCNYNQAAEFYRKALTLNQSNSAAHLGMLRIYNTKKDYINAKNERNEVNRITEEEYTKLLTNGQSLLKTKKYTEAASYFLKAFQLNPARFEACSELASILRQQKKLNDAVYFLEQYKIHSPQDQKVYFMLGEIYYSEMTYSKERKINLQRSAWNIETGISLITENPAEKGNLLIYYLLLKDVYSMLGDDRKKDEITDKIDNLNK